MNNRKQQQQRREDLYKKKKEIQSCLQFSKNKIDVLALQEQLTTIETAIMTIDSWLWGFDEGWHAAALILGDHYHGKARSGPVGSTSSTEGDGDIAQ